MPSHHNSAWTIPSQTGLLQTVCDRLSRLENRLAERESFDLQCALDEVHRVGPHEAVLVVYRCTTQYSAYYCYASSVRAASGRTLD